MTNTHNIAKVLELARWAPSGDNTQPWRFEILAEDHIVVHGRDTRDVCVYDLDGHPSQLSLGALLETIAIAATAHGLRTETVRRIGLPDPRPTFDLRFSDDQAISASPLIGQIIRRSVQRRPMRLRRLTIIERRALEQAVGDQYRVIWIEQPRDKFRMAGLLFNNAKLRLTMPEAYQVHRDIIHWGVRFSEDRVPDQALGVDRISARLMHWAMRDWTRINFLNRFLAGTLMPRLQMDLIPALLCGAHFIVISKLPMAGIDDYIAAGRAVQRFWLTLTHLELVMQPELTPLIFGRYARQGRAFSKLPGTQEEAMILFTRLESIVGERVGDAAVFMGRVGAGSPATARSTRRPLEELMLSTQG